MMRIQKLSQTECVSFLERNHFGHIACASDGRPYVTPFFFTCRDGLIHSFATLGKKIEWLRQNPFACVEVERIESPQNWTTVIASGKYEEVSDGPAGSADRETINSLLRVRPIWWEPGFAKTVVEGATRPLIPIYFKLRIDELSGHIASQGAI